MLDKTNLDWKANCIAHCFDGASVMTKLADHFRETTQNVNQHIWCHSHHLSLTFVDHCSLIDHPSVQQLFSMLQNLFNFVNAGYKRCAVFVNTVNGSKHNQGGSKKLAKFLTHKWQGRCKAVTSLKGRFISEDAEKQVNDGLIVQLIATLDLIAADTDFDVETRGTAFALLQQVLRKESIVLAILYSQMMSPVDELMSMMQFRDSNYSSVNQLISATLLKLKETGKKFDHFWRYADSYCKVLQRNVYVIMKLDSENSEMKNDLERLVVSYGNGGGSVRMKQLYAFPRSAFKEIRSLIFGNILTEMRVRFSDKGCEDLNSLCSIACPNMLIFNTDQEIDAYNFNTYIAKFPSLNNIDCVSLKKKLKLRLYLKALGTRRIVIINDDNEMENSETETSDSEKRVLPENNYKTGAHKEKNHLVHQCLVWTYKYILQRRALGGSLAMKNTFHIYHHNLTLSVDIDECERVFSALKHVKNKLRNKLTQEHTRDTLLCFYNADILEEIPLDEIVNLFVEGSYERRRLLLG
ncbi:uncharacterized protein LOC136093749 [Hydra vulgaris]|uniref:uncharacterized protein LOC136093749 n=1 Tax=Hydra vulgaris TaxID=6087 RepID=UPI0032EA8627